MSRSGTAAAAAAAWQSRGTIRRLRGRDVFVVDVGDGPGTPAVLVHGFPTSSHDWAPTIDRLATGRRVLAFDLVGLGLSEKPDQPFRLSEQADLAQSLVVDAGLVEVDLVTHDIGDTIGGELLARDLDRELPFTVRRRVVTNGSIYLEDASLRFGHRILSAMPDRRLPVGIPRVLFDRGIRELFGTTPISDHELDVAWLLLRHADGDRLMPRIIRYLDERRDRQDRFTGAIEAHPSPLQVVWGTVDPVAVVSMVDRLLAARGDRETDVRRLDGVGHFPMIEVADRFADLVTDWLDR